MTTDPIIERLRPRLEQLLRGRSLLRSGPLPLAAEALVAWTLQRQFEATVVFITDGRQSLDLAHRDLETLAPAGAPAETLLYYPARETLFEQNVHEDPDIIGYRLKVLQRLAAPGKSFRDGCSSVAGVGSTLSPGVGDSPSSDPGRQVGPTRATPPRLIATCIQAVMQRPISREALSLQSLALAVGQDLEMDEVMQRIIDFGYEIAFEVNIKGQACRRGGLIDLWPVTELWPVRLEFFGSQIESIRTFEPSTQRSQKKHERIEVPPLAEKDADGADAGAAGAFLEYLPDDAVFLWSNREFVEQYAHIFQESAREAGRTQAIESLSTLRTELSRRDAKQVFTGCSEADLPGLDFVPVSRVPELRGRSFVPDIQESARQRLVQQFIERARGGQTVHICLETGGAEKHFLETLPEKIPPRLHVGRGALSGGFISEELALVVVAETDLYGQRQTSGQRYTPRTARGGPDRIPAARITGLGDIEPGDLVVHVEHGLGRYMGLFDIVMNGAQQEVLTVEYADEARLHIPVSQAHLLSRYVGVSPHQVRLHRLGGRRWSREKLAADEAIMDLASSLLELQAERSLLSGHAFPADTTWQHEFEASFPYAETVDQARVIEEVRVDLESTRPMDRLLCGDAGYGKTEVAMRAAFKAVMGERQVAVLVPTTVLAQQHFDTFRERMTGYPIRIELLSRFRTQKERGRVIEDLAAGAVDIVIGTHGLLNPQLRFKDLGLVITDEEQRFGVVHKERLKQLRRLVDVLTMTATPIPRTLYMSLTGARDISLLQTPPRERMAIETIVVRNSDEVVRKALMHEVNREGQAFYLYNRVLTIGRVRERLEALVPEMRFGVAHGQMPTAELEAVMHAFVAGEFDVLICTTIIESGLDIPRANTILIDRADRFGIADLYQLRGRVGRSNRKAFAYLLLPATGHIEPDARRRIAALQKFSGLSSGLNLAMRDLEIRGAGNLLGVSQSGHINAIGFGLYCQLLNRTVARMKNQPLPPVIDVTVNLDFISLTSGGGDEAATAVIPYEYVEDERMRVDMYRKIAEAATREDVAAARDELRDRFGPMPASVDRLLRLAELRIAAAGKGLVHVETQEDKLMLKDPRDFLMQNKRFPRLTAAAPDDKLAEILELIATCGRWRDG
jgi:transcription-repair coupling factor (superfamily II helicase)